MQLKRIGGLKKGFFCGWLRDPAVPFFFPWGAAGSFAEFEGFSRDYPVPRVPKRAADGRKVWNKKKASVGDSRAREAEEAACVNKKAPARARDGASSRSGPPQTTASWRRPSIGQRQGVSDGRASWSMGLIRIVGEVCQFGAETGNRSKWDNSIWSCVVFQEKQVVGWEEWPERKWSL